MHLIPAGLPSGIPGIGELIEGYMQHAPQPVLHSIGGFEGFEGFEGFQGFSLQVAERSRSVGFQSFSTSTSLSVTSFRSLSGAEAPGFKIQMFRCSLVQMFKCSNVQMFPCSSTPNPKSLTPKS